MIVVERQFVAKGIIVMIYCTNAIATQLYRQI